LAALIEFLDKSVGQRMVRTSIEDLPIPVNVSII
jgi:hypothetical protein